MTLEQMAEACGGILHAGLDQEKIRQQAAGVIIDSRKAQPGCVFIAAEGERVDGHDFIPSVYKQGALGVVCEKAPVAPAGPYILVKNSFQALKDIAQAYRKTLTIPVVGITGSVGKTSTKELIASVLEQKYHVLKTAGNYNNEVGLPLTVMQIRQEHTAAVLEMGISEFGEMHRLSKIARPDICVITNIGQCHLESLHSRDGILQAKSEIFDYMAKNAGICLNGDDDKLCTLTEVKGIKPVFFGMHQNHPVYADEIENKGLFGSVCRIHTPQGEFTAQIPLPGVHMVYNALAAAAVGIMLGLSLEQIRAGIASVKPVGGRSNLIRCRDRTVIDDCYNANPASVKGALDLLSTALTRKVAVLGDMFELGSDEASLHEEIGRYAVGKADVLLCVGGLSRHMYEAAKQALSESVHDDARTQGKDCGMKLHYYETRDALEADLPNVLKRGDTILVKASHGMGLSHVVEILKDENGQNT